MTDDCMGCRVPGYSHAAYCPEGRVEELRSRLAHAEACLAEKHLKLAEAEALLLVTKRSVLCVAEDAYRARRLDISDSQYALLNRIDAYFAADSAPAAQRGSLAGGCRCGSDGSPYAPCVCGGQSATDREDA